MAGPLPVITSWSLLPAGIWTEELYLSDTDIRPADQPEPGTKSLLVKIIMHFMEKIVKIICLSILAGALALSHPAVKKQMVITPLPLRTWTKPGPVTNVKIVNFNGGAYITYTLPDQRIFSMSGQLYHQR